MSTQPISPAAAREAHKVAIPAPVFDVLNSLLTLRAQEQIITITQAEVVDALEVLGIEREEIFRQRMLDFEGAYEAMGWVVKYDNPGWNEIYGASWSFWAS